MARRIAGLRSVVAGSTLTRTQRSVTLIDPHPHVTDPQDGADPAVFGECRSAGCLDQQVGTEALDVELGADHGTDGGDRLSGDQRQRHGVEHALVLLDDARSVAELGGQRRVYDVELAPGGRAHHGGLSLIHISEPTRPY